MNCRPDGLRYRPGGLRYTCSTGFPPVSAGLAACATPVAQAFRLYLQAWRPVLHL